MAQALLYMFLQVKFNHQKKSPKVQRYYTMDKGAYSPWSHKRVGHDLATKQWHYLHFTGGVTEAQRNDFFRCT